MGIVIRLFELLIVVVPLVAVIIGGMKAVSAARGRLLDASGDTGGVAQPSGRTSGNQSAQWRAITRTVKEHDRTDIRWLDYELDVTKLLDFPLMTDMREPLTVEFHKAKRRADLLRPATAEALVGDRRAQEEYREAVHSYVIAFDVAEAEAKRRRRGGFSRDEQEHLVRAQSLLRLAMDEGATSAERQSAYRKAQRELEGLISLPPSMRAQIERHIAGQIEA